jgi:ornithine--oxo-acid transaminase
VKDIRGRGLYVAIQLDTSKNVSAWDFCLKLKENGIITKNTQNDIIRLCPPLTIKEEEVDKALEIINKCL